MQNKSKPRLIERKKKRIIAEMNEIETKMYTNDQWNEELIF